jgi:predicted SPOUT superfamily RNA methylase MTH1
VDKKLKPGVRVTVQKVDLSNSHKFKGVVVSPETPRIKNGIYWGYQVRYASSFKKVLHGI